MSQYQEGWLLQKVGTQDRSHCCDWTWSYSLEAFEIYVQEDFGKEDLEMWAREGLGNFRGHSWEQELKWQLDQKQCVLFSTIKFIYILPMTETLQEPEFKSHGIIDLKQISMHSNI